MQSENNLINFTNQVLNRIDEYTNDTSFNFETQEYARCETLKEVRYILTDILQHHEIDMLLEECDRSYEERKQRKDKFINVVNEKIDKMTDEQIDKFTEWFEELK